MPTDPMSFLQAVSGAMATGAPSPVMRIATIDPAYDPDDYPGTLPFVTFDGETVLSGKRYLALSPYRPEPSDRVIMMPVGNTYVIAGCIDHAAGQLITQSGSQSMSPSAQSSLSATGITFPVPFLAAPHMTANIASGAGATARWGSRAIAVTTTTFSMFIFATDGDGTTTATFTADVHWTARGRVAG